MFLFRFLREKVLLYHRSNLVANAVGGRGGGCKFYYAYYELQFMKDLSKKVEEVWFEPVLHIHALIPPPLPSTVAPFLMCPFSTLPKRKLFLSRKSIWGCMCYLLLIPPPPYYACVLHCTFQWKFESLTSSFSPISTLVTIRTIGFDIKKSSTCSPHS